MCLCLKRPKPLMENKQNSHYNQGTLLNYPSDGIPKLWTIITAKENQSICFFNYFHSFSLSVPSSIMWEKFLFLKYPDAYVEVTGQTDEGECKDRDGRDVP